MNDSIVDAFKLLGIHEDDYPEYADAESFASNFKPCSVFEESDVSTSNSTIINQK